MENQLIKNETIKNPLVTILVPSYNHAKYITQCIDNIFNQTYRNFELFVIDDGSTDNSRKILEELKSKYGFTLIFQENHGVAYTINRGIKEFSNGKYITFCASDDFWTLDKLEKQVNFLESNRFYPMCYGKTFYIDESSKIIEAQDINNKVLKGGWIFNEIFVFKIHPPVNYMYQSSIFKEVGLFNEKIFAEDYNMNLKISSKYPIGFINEYLGYYRFTDTPFKIIRYEKVSDSHLMAIETFKNHRLYKKAKTMVFLRRFDTYAGYAQFKNKALINLINSLSNFYKKRFFIALVKLIIYWRK